MEPRGDDGWGANGVGALLIAGGIGYVALQSGGNFDNLDFNAPDAQIGFGVATAGGILIGASFLLASSIGPDKPLNRFELVLDPRDEATAAADEYNRKVRGEPPVEAEPAAEPEVAPGDG